MYSMKRPLTRKRVGAYFRQQILTIPNAVTLGRLFCALGMFVWSRELLVVFWLALVGGISDIIDGSLAKYFGWGTLFGKRFDQYTDWLFGIALLYTIYLAGEGLRLYEWPYNAELLVLIGGYLIWRLKFPKVETTFMAKIKTAMQFAGGIVILAGHAHVPEWFLEENGYDDFLLTFGYLLVWASVGLMFLSGWEYRKQEPNPQT